MNATASIVSAAKIVTTTPTGWSATRPTFARCAI
jgi:hypothetical protein